MSIYRIVAYTSVGEWAGVLDDAKEVSVSFKTGRAPTLKFSYPLTGQAGMLVSTGRFQIGLEYYDQKQKRWVEESDCRFFVRKRVWDASLGGLEYLDFEALAVSARLENVILGFSRFPAKLTTGAGTGTEAETETESESEQGFVRKTDPQSSPYYTFVPLESAPRQQSFDPSASWQAYRQATNLKNSQSLTELNERLSKNPNSNNTGLGSAAGVKGKVEALRNNTDSLTASALNPEGDNPGGDDSIAAFYQARARQLEQARRPAPTQTEGTDPSTRAGFDYTLWQFGAKTAGQILDPIWRDAKARGALEGIEINIVHDSVPLTLQFETGQTLAHVVATLEATGAVRASWQGNTLRLVAPRNPYASNTVRGFWPLSSISTGKETEDWSQNATRVLVIGENKQFFFCGSPGGAEKTVKARGVTTQDEAEIAAAPYIIPGPKTTISRTWEGSTDFWPLADYRLGDLFSVQPHPAPLYVAEMHFGWDGAKTSGEVIFGSSKDTLEEQLVARAKALSGGGHVTAQGLPADRDKTPDAVTGLVVSGSTSISEDGHTIAMIHARWTPQTNVEYQTAWIVEDQQEWKNGPVTTVPYANMQTLGAGAYLVRVRALNKQGTPGPWSNPVRVDILADDTIPNKPSQPALSEFFRTVTISWDGTQEDGTLMDADVTQCAVYYNTTPNPETALAAGEVTQVASKTIGPLEKNTTYYIWLKAIDATGNESPLSQPATITTSLVEDASAFFQAGAIKAGMLEANAVTAASLSADAITAKHTIIGATIKTDPRPARGFEVTGNTVRMYSAGGARLLDFDGQNGDLTIEGNITANELHARNGGYSTNIDSNGLTVTNNNNPIIEITRWNTKLATSALSGTITNNYSNGNATLNTSGASFGNGAMYIDKYSNINCTRRINLDGALVVGTGNVIYWGDKRNAESPSSLTADGYGGIYGAGGGNVVTTGGFLVSAHANIARGLYVGDSVSAVSFDKRSTLDSKRDITPLPDITGLLDVDLIKYRSREEWEHWRQDNLYLTSEQQERKKQLETEGRTPTLPPRYHAGFTVESFIENGLEIFCSYDQNGRPYAIDYSATTTALVQVGRQHREKIRMLEEKILTQQQIIEKLKAWIKQTDPSFPL